VSIQRLATHPVGKALEAAARERREQPEPTYLVEMAFAATAWQALAEALLRAGIERNDSEAAESAKICSAIAAVRIERSALLLPWDGLSFDSATNGVDGARVVALGRRGDSIATIWPSTP
jgi:hypothetical protein